MRVREKKPRQKYQIALHAFLYDLDLELWGQKSSKFLHVFLTAIFQEKARCWGCWHEEASYESAEGCTLTFLAEGNWCFSHGSCFIENCWIINQAATTSVLQRALLPLFYKMPLTNKGKSLEPMSRRLKGGRGITQYHCGLLTPFLWHIQYKFCAQFSLIFSGHWKSSVPELTSSQRWTGKRGKIDIVGLCVDVQFCCSQTECIHLWKWHFFVDNWWDGSGLKTQGFKIISDILNNVRSDYGEVNIFPCWVKLAYMVCLSSLLELFQPFLEMSPWLTITNHMWMSEMKMEKRINWNDVSTQSGVTLNFLFTTSAGQSLKGEETIWAQALYRPDSWRLWFGPNQSEKTHEAVPTWLSTGGFLS